VVKCPKHLELTLCQMIPGNRCCPFEMLVGKEVEVFTVDEWVLLIELCGKCEACAEESDEM
jgi:hypothetical protein